MRIVLALAFVFFWHLRLFPFFIRLWRRRVHGISRKFFRFKYWTSMRRKIIDERHWFPLPQIFNLLDWTKVQKTLRSYGDFYCRNDLFAPRLLIWQMVKVRIINHQYTWWFIITYESSIYLMITFIIMITAWDSQWHRNYKDCVMLDAWRSTV